MATTKVRLIDTDVLSNMLLMGHKGNIDLNISQSTGYFQLITTDIVCSEIQSGLNKAKNKKIYHNVMVDGDELDEIYRLWINIKSKLIIKKGRSDPTRLKDRGEQSLVYLSQEYKNNLKIVSNNKKDVINFLTINKLSISLYETPFEFYEEMHKSWFKDYKDLIKFMILANNDFRIYDKNSLGKNILKQV